MSGASTWKDRCWVLLYSVKPILDTQCVQYSSINCIFAIDSSEPDCFIQPCIWSCPTYPLAFLPIHAAYGCPIAQVLFPVYSPCIWSIDSHLSYSLTKVHSKCDFTKCEMLVPMG